MNITINNQLIVICLFFFFLSYFFAYLFKKSNLFFKLCLFLFIATIFSLIEQFNRIEITISSLLGVLVVYGESILDFAFMVRSWFEFIIDCIKSLFQAIFNFIKTIFLVIFSIIAFPFKLVFKVIVFVFRWIFWLFKFFASWEPKPREKKQGQQQKGSSQQAGMEEELRQAKEELKKARERAKKQEEDRKQSNSSDESKVNNTDTRSFEQILGLNQNFTKDDLKRAYQMAVSRYHPDKYTHMSKAFQEEAQREFVKIKQAYNVLSGRVS